ncbi:helix-turn-helix domain-containing protein [Palleronia caenipelagi]|uniref:Transcriptional regulator n=1 Tax=Palleronia caenipelagi TaxID=2489174 RepID=A0A547PMZ6_9RHOB|nr:helix-turn-helix domain-containing protein [Palleronia caenipelagi]TRD15528.1 transcriptional regulator [Palleronia caenipelagi]
MAAGNRRDLAIHKRIQKGLRARGMSMAQLSRDLEVTQGSMSLVSRGLHRSKRIEKAIADALETTPEQLFPDRYSQQEGRPPP